MCVCVCTCAVCRNKILTGDPDGNDRRRPVLVESRSSNSTDDVKVARRKRSTCPHHPIHAALV